LDQHGEIRHRRGEERERHVRPGRRLVGRRNDAGDDRAGILGAAQPALRLPARGAGVRRAGLRDPGAKGRRDRRDQARHEEVGVGRMREKTITITISPKGEVSFEVNGVKGKACLDETKFLEDALGGKVIAQESTAEMYEQGELDTEQIYNK